MRADSSIMWMSAETLIAEWLYNDQPPIMIDTHVSKSRTCMIATTPCNNVQAGIMNVRMAKAAIPRSAFFRPVNNQLTVFQIGSNRMTL